MSAKCEQAQASRKRSTLGLVYQVHILLSLNEYINNSISTRILKKTHWKRNLKFAATKSHLASQKLKKMNEDSFLANVRISYDYDIYFILRTCKINL